MILIALYLSVNLAYHGSLTMEEIARLSKSKDAQSVAVIAAERLLGTWAAWTAGIVIMVSTFGALNSNMLVTPRVSFAMGRDRTFFPQLGYVHANYHTPAVAIFVQAAMACLLVATSGVLVETVAGFEHKNIFDMLTDFVIFGASIFYVAGVVSLLVLRRTRSDLPRPYRTTLYPWVPLAFLLAYAWFLWQVFWNKRFEAIAGLGLIAAGLPFYAGLRWWFKAAAEAEPTAAD